MARDPEFMAMLEYVWTHCDTDQTWHMLFERMLQLMDRDELKDLMRTAYSEHSRDASLGKFEGSNYRAEESSDEE